jgi:hypothetical protein
MQIDSGTQLATETSSSGLVVLMHNRDAVIALRAYFDCAFVLSRLSDR